MNALSNLWAKLTRSKAYREAFVASHLKRGIPAQIRILRKQRRWKQTELAERARLTQGVISRSEDPDYGNLTFNTILQIAAGLDVAFHGRFVPFSDLAKWVSHLSEEALQVPSFSEDTLAKEGAASELHAVLSKASTAPNPAIKAPVFGTYDCVRRAGGEQSVIGQASTERLEPVRQLPSEADERRFTQLFGLEAVSAPAATAA